MEDDFMDFYADWANDFIWSRDFEIMTAKDYENSQPEEETKEEKREKIDWDFGTPELPF